MEMLTKEIDFNKYMAVCEAAERHAEIALDDLNGADRRSDLYTAVTSCLKRIRTAKSIMQNLSE